MMNEEAQSKGSFSFNEEAYNRRLDMISVELANLQAEKLRITLNINRLKQEQDQLQKDYAIAKLKEGQSSKWLLEQFSWSSTVIDVLKSVFGFSTFLPNQLAAINATLSHKDVLVVVPTAGGKSLIYQLAAVVSGKLTVVVSPLISLIADQIRSLESLKIQANTLNSSMERQEKTAIMNKMVGKKLSIIFVTPEYFAKSKVFMNNLAKLHRDNHIVRFVIDEVHCCSQWGHDFRVDYQNLSLIKTQFSGVPILGLTATATTDILVDIQNMLQLEDPVVITAPYNRPNLFYKVVIKPETVLAAQELVSDYIKNQFSEMSGIVYAATSKECDDLTAFLRGENIRAAPYYANLEPRQKTKVYQRWIEGRYKVIVATIAFGMGIDKPDVRFVIHYSLPKSVEALYQETGRAGRDGGLAHCILMFSLVDWLKAYAHTENSKEERNIKHVLSYSIDVQSCRRKLLAAHFDDDWRNIGCNKMCDYCADATRDLVTYNVRQCLVSIRKAISILSGLEITATLKKLQESWCHLGPKKLRVPGEAPKFNKTEGDYIIAFLISKNYLNVTRGYSLVGPFAVICASSSEIPEREISMKYSKAIRGLEKLKCPNENSQKSSQVSIKSSSDKRHSQVEDCTKKSKSDQLNEGDQIKNSAENIANSGEKAEPSLKRRRVV